MTSLTVGTIPRSAGSVRTCARCHRLIRGGGTEFIRLSGPQDSDAWAHAIRDPACRPIAAADPR